MSEEKKVYVVSLGCPKNRVDTDVMLGHLARDGYTPTDRAEDADLLLVNTCSFIQSATEESVDAVLELAELRRGSADKRLVVAGCMAQRYPEQLREELPEVDVFVGTGKVPDIRSAVREARQGKVGDVHRFVGLPEWVQSPEEPRVNSLSGRSAYLKILEGCPQSCSFCIIPTLRGGLVSRPVGELLGEAERLVDAGVRELVLIGQDNSSYGYDLGRDVRLPDLLGGLSELDRLRWLRVMYLYPARVNDALVEAFATLPKVLPYIDMPLQHASDRILKAMRRGTTLDKQRALLARLRGAIPDLTVRSAFIVGFPGETDEDFEQLLSFVEEQRFDRLGTFLYSAEEGTPAAELGDPVPEELARERQARLMELQQRISEERHEDLVGRELEVLVEGTHPESDLLLVGRAASQAPEIDGVVILTDHDEGPPPQPGEFRRVRIDEAHAYDLVGTVVGPTLD